MTLTTGHKNNRRRTTAPGGFTLLELIVVLLVIGVVLGLASPSLRGFFTGRKTADVALDVVSMTQWAHSQAVSQGRPYRMNFDSQGHCWLTTQRAGAYVDVPGEETRRLSIPEGVRVTLETTSTQEAASFIQFYPSGRTQAAKIKITGPKSERFVVACDGPADRFRILTSQEASQS